MRNIFQTKDKMAANASVEAVPSLESLVSRARDLFRDKFGREAQVGGAAPGRVNLIGKQIDTRSNFNFLIPGEHTDYNMGLVFPMALPLVTVVLGAKSEDPGSAECRLYSSSQVRRG